MVAMVWILCLSCLTVGLVLRASVLVDIVDQILIAVSMLC